MLQGLRSAAQQSGAAHAWFRGTIRRLPARRHASTGEGPMKKRDLTRSYTRAQFAAKLRRLADSIETAEPFTIQVAGEKLRVPAEATFNIEHERIGGEEELEFQLIWTRP